MSRRHDLADDEVAAEVERLIAANGVRPGADPAVYRRYLADCVRSGVDPYSVSLAVRTRVAEAFARADARLQALPARGNAPGETGDAGRTSVNTTDGHHSNGGRGGS